MVWFKRDLRVADHEALRAACDEGPVLALYVFEPELLEAPEADRGHFGFVLESLYALDQSLIDFGSSMKRQDFDRAVACLENLELTPETEAMWTTLSNAW